jgi:hypothetical protein
MDGRHQQHLEHCLELGRHGSGERRHHGRLASLEIEASGYFL